MQNRVLFLLGILSCNAIAFAGSNYDWRFADPNSQLIAGSSVSPASSQAAATILLSALTPVSRIPAAFVPLLPQVSTITYSEVSGNNGITVLSGSFALPAWRSAGAQLGLVSSWYRGVEILATPSPSGRMQIALINSTTIVLGNHNSLHGAVNRYIDDPFAFSPNPLIQTAATFSSGWDTFAMSSGISAAKSLTWLFPNGQRFVNTTVPALESALTASTGFTFRGRFQNFRLELNLAEPDAATAANAAQALTAAAGKIKMGGAGGAEMLESIRSNLSIQAVGSGVQLILDPNLYTLTVKVQPAGAGTISPATLGVPFAANSIVRLNATPGKCFGSPQWSSNAPNGVVTMNGNQTVTVTFTPGSCSR